MKLLNYTVINYKSAKKVHVELSDDQINTFIGVNDCGKSTLLKGLKLFFDDKPLVEFESESSKKSVLSNSTLSIEDFDEFISSNALPTFELYNEDLVATYLEFEIQKLLSIEELEGLNTTTQIQYILSSLNVGDRIKVMRTFNNDGSKSDYYIVVDEHVDEDGQHLSLWAQTQANIKKIQAESGIKDADIVNRNGVGALKNNERILAIYEKIDTQPTWSKFNFKKDSVLFPSIRYLDWNISSDELNQLTGDIIRPIVDNLLEPIQKQVNLGKDKINVEANEELKKLYTKYSGFLPSSISGINANVNIDLKQAVTELFVEKFTSDQKIHIDEQGDGIRRQIGLGLIKAISQESLDDEDMTKKHIWCLDEPETHLYPQAQRDLLESLMILAKSQFQILISTHSTLFVDKSNISDINQVLLEDGYTTIKTTSNTDDVLLTLGVRNSDFLFYNRFIAVEGSTEYGIFDHLYKLCYGVTLSEDGIQLISLGGESNSGLQERLMNDIFKDFKKSEDLMVYILDKDTGRVGDNVVVVGNVADFEDSLSDDIWIKAIKDFCGVTLTPSEITEYRGLIDINNSSTKLHKSLSKHVADRYVSEYLPSKGDSLAGLLTRYITSKDDVPADIIKGFEMARKVISS